MIESTITPSTKTTELPTLIRDRRDGQIFIATRFDAGISVYFGIAVTKSGSGFQKEIGGEMSLNVHDCEPFTGIVTLQNK